MRSAERDANDGMSHTGSADLSRPEPMIDRRLRLASSSPDVKALFNNSPQYIYHLDEAQESLDSQPNYPPIQPQVNDYWNPQGQPPMIRHGRFLSMSHVNDEMSPASGVPPHARFGLSPDDIPGSFHRGSDSLLEAKLKDQMSKPNRSLTNRAQSLDLTLSLQRITESGARYGPGGPPDSPTNSLGETAHSSSPTSATGPSFPSVYGPPSGSGGLHHNNHHHGHSHSISHSHTHPHGRGLSPGDMNGGGVGVVGGGPGMRSHGGTPQGFRRSRLLEDETVDDDDVSRVMSNLGL